MAHCRALHHYLPGKHNQNHNESLSYAAILQVKIGIRDLKKYNSWCDHVSDAALTGK